MSAIIVVDAFWGDLGKGTVAAHFALLHHAAYCVRAGTGTNAGHSIFFANRPSAPASAKRATPICETRWAAWAAAPAWRRPSSPCAKPTKPGPTLPCLASPPTSSSKAARAPISPWSWATPAPAAPRTTAPPWP
ncbi:MAG: adenylosuccinate synthetase [Candidatus Handelsmanbacteria bacterium]|nr:adenylosuccinate synthetase [Candidatus Handelsmanbacteria bacterium]